MSERDFQKFDEACRKSLCHNRSQYMRKMLLGKPVTIHCRNSSLDDFIEMAVKLRRDFAVILAASALTWEDKEALKENVAQIQFQLINVAELCSPK